MQSAALPARPRVASRRVASRRVASEERREAAGGHWQRRLGGTERSGNLEIRVEESTLFERERERERLQLLLLLLLLYEMSPVRLRAYSAVRCVGSPRVNRRSNWRGEERRGERRVRAARRGVFIL